MRIFITGGTSGIGLSLCKLYLQEGHEVGICGRSLEKLPQGFPERYPSLKCYQLDVLDRDHLKRAVADFSQGKLDILIANAGISGKKSSSMVDFERGREIFSVNILGVFNAIDVAMSEFITQRKGQIVLMSSVAGFIGLPWAPAYSASKAAVLKMGESFSVSLKDFGITVTTIAPGFIDSPLTRRNKYKMPFLLSAEDGALKIKKAIDGKDELVVFPWQMKLIIGILDKIPRSLYRFFMKLKIIDYSEG